MKISKTEVNHIFVLAFVYTIVNLKKLIIKLPRFSFLLKLISRLVSVIAVLKSLSSITNVR